MQRPLSLENRDLEVQVVYSDAARRPDANAISKIELWHSDVTYEIQPPKYGGDTFWSSGLKMQAYLEGLAALHSAVASGGISGLQTLHRVVSTVGGVGSDGGMSAELHSIQDDGIDERYPEVP
ncbi:hypothetical protein EDD22DRAFT_851677 [Suillus occidentalis]|nr:hypothetical protein EDD22DRAFT_851677 [Suillus occidentalis]